MDKPNIKVTGPKSKSVRAYHNERIIFWFLTSVATIVIALALTVAKANKWF